MGLNAKRTFKKPSKNRAFNRVVIFTHKTVSSFLDEMDNSQGFMTVSAWVSWRFSGTEATELRRCHFLRQKQRAIAEEQCAGGSSLEVANRSLQQLLVFCDRWKELLSFGGLLIYGKVQEVVKIRKTQVVACGPRPSFWKIPKQTILVEHLPSRYLQAAEIKKRVEAVRGLSRSRRKWGTLFVSRR